MSDQKTPGETPAEKGPTELSDDELKLTQGGYTATDDLWQWRKKAPKEDMTGGFKSVSGMNSDSE